MGDSSPTSEAVLGNMPSDLPDWTQAVQLQGTVDIASVTTIEFINTIKGAKTVEVVNKATTIVVVGNYGKTFAAITDGTGITARKIRYTIPAATMSETFSVIRGSLVGIGPSPSFVKFAPVAVKVTSPTTTNTYGWVAPVGQTSTTTTTASRGEFIVSGSFDKGQDAYLDAYFVNTVRTLRGGIRGLTSNPGVQLRSDGRAYPIGSLRATVTITGAGNVIAAPTSPLRIMLRSLSIVPANTASTGITQFVVTGGSQDVGRAMLQPTKGVVVPFMRNWDAGLLLPAGTALTYSRVGTNPAFVTVDYDLVV